MAKVVNRVGVGKRLGFDSCFLKNLSDEPVILKFSQNKEKAMNGGRNS